MFRNSISTTISGSAVRKTASVGLLVAGVVATSPFLRGTTGCTEWEFQQCMADCGGQLPEFCVVGNNGLWYCHCS